MTFEESRQRSQFASTLQPPALIHLVGICGTGMSAVAVLLKQLGFTVQGSDKAFYPPMGEVVSRTAVRLFEGYSVENLAESPALVVIGNNLSRGNPEVEYVLEQGIPYASMPEVFQGLLIGSRESCATSIVVTGTHGKTTTSAAIAVMFDRAGRGPGYFVGGVPRDLPDGIRRVDPAQPQSKRVVVLEGDEYDSAFFAKWSKFLSYRPDIGIITSIEFDHADIYQNLSEIESEFTRFVSLIPKSGALLLADRGDNLDRLAKEWEQKFGVTIYRYGATESAPFRLISRERGEAEFAQILTFSLRGEECRVRTRLTGEYNAMNLLVAAAAGALSGLTSAEIASSLAQFSGVLRRQFVHGEWCGVMLIEDFAHHPTAVEVTLRGIKEEYPERRLRAVYEPRSNTSRRGFFQNEYPKSFDAADEVLILEVTEPGSYSKTESTLKPIDIPKIVEEIRGRGKECRSYPSIPDLERAILESARPGDLLCCMSNGDFGGLVPRLTEELRKRPSENRE